MAGGLVPYVPRLAVEWAAETPERQWLEVDGSLVFVDISGFTALSERLARRGRVGAEELTGTLSDCFADLLSVAYAAGGSLIKFGGDALLLLFDGAGHPERACKSAALMRSRLVTAGQVTTSAGTVRLRMSVGVHSGAVHLFRVGETHKELIVAGPGASLTVEMESTAAAGEILVSAATAAHLPAGLVGKPKGAGYLLRRRANVTVNEGLPPAVSPAADVSDAIPTALRAHLQLGPSESEHRQATVAFIHFDEVDDLTTRAGPDKTAAALHELVCDIQRASDENGVTFLGSDVDRDGGKVILVAGAPLAQGDDDGRMLRALRWIADRPRTLPVRIGVNHGHVFVGEVGPPYRRTYTVMGDAVNLAARVMAKAAPGEILATSPVLDGSATAFEATPVPPFMVKGKTQPVVAFTVGARGRRRARAATQRLPFAGRQAELAQLIDLVRRAEAGHGGLVEISGESGIGKSRLVEEFCEQTTAARVVRVFCEPYEAKTPYFGFRYLLRGLLGIRTTGTDASEALHQAVDAGAPELLPWLPLLGAVMELEVGETPESAALELRFRRERTRSVVVDIMRRLVDTPVILVIEDAQWLDDLSAELVSDVALAAQDHPWLICMTRSGEPSTDRPTDACPTLRLRLEPLDETAARSLVAAGTALTPLRPDERDVLVRQAGGNALFLEELLRARLSLGSTDQLPSSLEGLIAAEIDRLPTDDRRLLRYAAVLGAAFDSALLADVADDTGRRATADAIRRLHAFLEPAGPGLTRFRNQCQRQVAYEMLPFSRRKQLHARAGERLEASGNQSESAGVLSFHFFQAERFDRCWYHATRAAEQARGKYANAEAVSLYERAVAAGKHLGTVSDTELAEAWEAMGDVALSAGTFARARTAFSEARRLHVYEPVKLANLCKKESRTASYQGRNVSSVRWLRRGLTHLAGQDNSNALAVRADLEMLFAQNCVLAGRPQEGVDWCERAIDDATASGNRMALADAYTLLDGAHIALGHPEQATHTQRAVEIWEEIGELGNLAAALTYMGAFAYWRGSWDEARTLFEQGRDAYLRAGNVVEAARGSCNIVDILIDQGRAEQGEESLRDALEIWRAVGLADGVAAALCNLGRIALHRSDYERAKELFEEAVRVSDGVSTQADAHRAECLLFQGDVQAALTTIDSALARSTATGDTTFTPMLHRLRGYALIMNHHPAEACSEFEQSLQVAQARGATYEVALTRSAMSEMARRGGGPADPKADAERESIIRDLGVIAIPQTPITTPGSSSL